MKTFRLAILQILILANTCNSVNADEKVIIAHRGASGYLPEHTLEAKTLAFAQGADYLEQDVVMTRDDKLIVMHDLILDSISDVARQFPGRQQVDGHFYVIDFSLEELRSLRLTEAVDSSSGTAVYANRFPVHSGYFTVHTLAEEIELIQGLEQTTGKKVGLYVELKAPWFHQMKGKDLAKAVLQELKHYGYDSKADDIFLQSFDYHALQRVQAELFPALDMKLKLVQLIAENSWEETFEVTASGAVVAFDYEWMLTPAGITTLATLVDGIGPQFGMLLQSPGVANAIVEQAHAAGLVVHPYTFRAEREQLPEYVDSLEALVEFFLYSVKVDGVFTDFPDRAIAVRNAHLTQ